jgi:DNA-binding transcriptional regulator YdaS (Cro superfamily)
MTLSEFFSAGGLGSVSKLAKHLGAHIPDVSRWASGIRPVPIRHCMAIEKFTKGAVTRKELRPNDWQLIWPDLAKTRRTKKGAIHG